MTRLFTLSLVAFLFSSLTQAQEAPKIKRMIFEVRHGTARNLAEVLNKHFKEEKTFQAVPEATSNALLLSGPADALTEAEAVLSRLDCAPRQVAVDIWIAQVTPAGSKGEEIPAKLLEGPSSEVKKLLEELHHKGAVSALRHYSLKALENQPATLTNSEMKPMVVGSGGGGFKGSKTMSVSMKTVGAKFTVTPRIPPDKAITLELNLEDTRLHTPDDAANLGMDDAGLPIRATEMLMSLVDTKATLVPGHAAPVQGVVTRSKSGASQIIVIVAARLLEMK